ncbi:MAG: hypothetical protein ACRDGM_10685, partial [bacterium]
AGAMSGRLDGRIALITGAAGGIPRAAATWGWTTSESANDLARPSIFVGPIWARWAPLAQRVVDALFVWASDDSRAHHDGLHVVGRDEFKSGPADLLVKPDIGVGGVPTLKGARFLSLRKNNANSYLRGSAGVRPVVRDRRNRISAESSSGLLTQSRKAAGAYHRLRPLLPRRPTLPVSGRASAPSAVAAG